MRQLLAELFDSCYQDIYRYLFSLCHDASLSEDLASEVFLEAVKSIAGFRGESSVKTWLFTIARRRWIAYLKKQNRQIHTLSISELPEWIAAEQLDDETDTVNFVRKFLSSEPELTRKVVRMRLDGYSYYEIASQLRISENSARVIYFRAKAKLKKQLEEEGFCYE